MYIFEGELQVQEQRQGSETARFPLYVFNAGKKVAVTERFVQNSGTLSEMSAFAQENEDLFVGMSIIKLRDKKIL